MDEIAQKKKNLEDLRAEGVDPYPNDFRPLHTTEEIHSRYGAKSREDLEKVEDTCVIAGRVMAIRGFGKASFLTLQDRKGKIQVYIRRDDVGEEPYRIFKKLDIGDIIGVQGKIFKTKTGELTVEAQSFRLLAKSLRPLPEKWHGLRDVEIRYRQRSLDLIVSPHVREIFLKRTRLISSIRAFFNSKDFIEVETPMMQTIAGGAVARPFKTHHNALGIDLYLRIAPELYLKRLVVGGMERVYEINRNFRNEGLSTLHNPEFTMLEFYQSYATYEDLMDLTEELFCTLAYDLCGGLTFPYQGHTIDLTKPWKRVSLDDAVMSSCQVDRNTITSRETMARLLHDKEIPTKDEMTLGELLLLAFEKFVEPRLIEPTFILGFPIDVSPLARRNDKDRNKADRFELFIAGMELANAFSELNDPQDQRERFLSQLQEKREDIPQELDEDFLMAMEYGMPPTAGEGIGIDRLTMLFTDSASIREVVLFPLLRPEK